MQTSSSNPGEQDEATSSESVAASAASRPRRWIAIAIALPLTAVVVLLVWGMVRSDFLSGAIGVNETFGEIPVKSKQASDFTITTLEGRNIELSKLRGRVVMIDFWASWCPPCRLEARGLAEVYRDYEGAPVEFIGINVWDEESDALAYIERYGVTYPNGQDLNGRISVEYGLAGLPEKFFIDQEGNLVKKFIGPMSGKALSDVVDELLDSAIVGDASAD